MKFKDKLLFNSLSTRHKYRLDLLGGLLSYDNLVKHLQLLARLSQVSQSRDEVNTQFCEAAFNEMTRKAKLFNNLEITTLALSNAGNLRVSLECCKKSLSNVKFKSINGIAIIEEIAFQIIRHTHCALDADNLNSLIEMCRIHFLLDESEVEGLKSTIELYKIYMYSCCLYCYISNINIDVITKCLINICKVDSMLQQLVNNAANSSIISGKNLEIAVSKFSTMAAYNNCLITRNSGAYNDNGLLLNIYRNKLLIIDSYQDAKFCDVAAVCSAAKLGLIIVCKTTVVNDCELRQYSITNTYKYRQQVRLQFVMNFDKKCTLIDKQQYCVLNEQSGIYSSVFIREQSSLLSFNNSKMCISVNLVLMPNIQTKLQVALCIDSNYRQMCYKYDSCSVVGFFRDNFISFNSPIFKSACNELVKFSSNEAFNSVSPNVPRQIECSDKYRSNKNIFLLGNGLDCSVSNNFCISLMCNGRVSVDDDNQQMWLIADRQAFCWDKAVFKLVNDTIIMTLDTPKIKAIATIIVGDKLEYFFKFINKTNKRIKASIQIRYNLTGRYNLTKGVLFNNTKQLTITADKLYLTHRHYGLINSSVNLLNGDCLIAVNNFEIQANAFINTSIALIGNASQISVNTLLSGNVELAHFNNENIKLAHLLNNNLINPTSMLLYTLSFSTHFVKDYCIQAILSAGQSANFKPMLNDRYAYVLGLLNYINLTNDKAILDCNVGRVSLRQFITCVLSLTCKSSYEQTMRTKCIKLAANIFEDRYLYISMLEQAADKLINGSRSAFLYAALTNAIAYRHCKQVDFDEVYNKYQNSLPSTYYQLMLLECRLGMRINCGVVSFSPNGTELPYKKFTLNNANSMTKINLIKSSQPINAFSSNCSIDLYNISNNDMNFNVSI